MSSEGPPGRFKSAWADLVVWTTILWFGTWAFDKIARAGLGVPLSTGPDPRDGLGLLSFGFAALCANVYLAISAAIGQSVGKALFGLRLIVADRPAKPGLARGLVRSSLQAGPWMGALMVVTGIHDTFAGTRIVADESAWHDQTVQESELLNEGPHVATWRVVLAVALHLFFPFVYMVIGAI